MLVAIQVNGQTFDFSCQLDFYSDELYSRILPSEAPDLEESLKVFIEDAVRHEHDKDLSHYLDQEFNIKVIAESDLTTDSLLFSGYDEHGDPQYYWGYGSWACDGSYYEVLLNDYFWSYPTYDYYKLTLLYHELGHAILGLAHTEVGIMAPNIPFVDYDEFTETVGIMFSGEGQNPFQCESSKSGSRIFTCGTLKNNLIL